MCDFPSHGSNADAELCGDWETHALKRTADQAMLGSS
ncbi:hypothetical protein F7D08_1205 [Bifidobacterium cebidarum]|uniref:Uncharacterized protein n=1 Tax=Bifidobacterium cebidarum TaxID=2650773 RepID=A0A6I1GJW2_9BIFI|nr:hypothetical protein F7D08_1205 [Bifidobacterium cebidarum]